MSGPAEKDLPGASQKGEKKVACARRTIPDKPRDSGIGEPRRESISEASTSKEVEDVASVSSEGDEDHSDQSGSFESPERDRGPNQLVDQRDFSEEESDEEMAQAKMKVLSPPTFHGKPDEDALDWLDRYEKLAGYNHWRHTDKHSNFVLFLEGNAGKW